VKKYLILGSSGQIGQSLVNYHSERGDIPIIFDIENSPKEDLRKSSQHTNLMSALDHCDFVYFLAFDVGGSRYLNKYQHTYDFFDNNIRIMFNTFDALKESGKPFIFTSSQMADMGHSPYGRLKKIGEDYSELLGGLVVKLWNVYGVEKDFEKSHVITDFIRQAKDRGFIRMLTDGTEMRQFLYADDCCEALSTLADKYSSLDRKEQYHISSFRWHTISEVAEEIAAIYGGLEVWGDVGKKDMVQKDARLQPDPNILNYWKPKTSLEDGIKFLCEYYDDDN